MKTHLLLAFGFGILSSAFINAQPTLTQSNSAPTVGGKLMYAMISYTGAGSAGANQTWDLSSVTPTAYDTTKFSNAASSAYASSFPLATITGKNSGAAYTYYKTSSTAWQNYGAVTSGGVILAYSDPEDMLQFPFTYNNTYTDPWSTVFMNGGYQFYRSGNITVTADGYGTLKLPNGTFSNILRVHVVEIYQDSADVQGFPYIINYNNDQYMWYLPGNEGAIASVFKLVSSAGTFSGGYYGTAIVAGINESNLLSSYSLFPNPTTENITINFNLSQAKKVEIKLYNSTGAEVKVAAVSEGMEGKNEYKIDTSTLPEGIYFAQINLDGSNANTRRFMVAK